MINSQEFPDSLYLFLHSKQLVLDVHLTQLSILQVGSNGLQVTPSVYYDEYPIMQVLQMAALLHEKQLDIKELHRLHAPSIRNEFEAHYLH